MKTINTLTAAAVAATLLVTNATVADAKTTDYEWFTPVDLSNTDAKDVFKELPSNKVCLFNFPESDAAQNFSPTGFAKKIHYPNHGWEVNYVKQSPIAKYAEAAGIPSSELDNESGPLGARELLSRASTRSSGNLFSAGVFMPTFYDPTSPERTYYGSYDQWIGNYGYKTNFSGNQLVQLYKNDLLDAEISLEAVKAIKDQEGAKQVTALLNFERLIKLDYLESLDKCVKSLEKPQNDGSKTIGIVLGIIASVVVLFGITAALAPSLGIKLPF